MMPNCPIRTRCAFTMNIAADWCEDSGLYLAAQNYRIEANALPPFMARDSEVKVVKPGARKRTRKVK